MMSLFLNTEGILDDVSGERKAFLDDVAGRNPDGTEDSYVKNWKKQ